MAFKAGVAAEVVALVSGSIGEQIYMSKVYFETAGLFAWTLVIIIISFVFEKLFTLILKGLIKLCCA
jgi:NitT/TauT family transport system permease protein